MIRIHIPVNLNSLTQCLCWISRDLFFEVTIKLKPLGLIVEAFPKLNFHIYVGRFHNKLGVGRLIQICINI